MGNTVLRNDGEREIHYGTNAEGATLILHPKRYANVSSEVAEKLKKLFPTEVTSIDDVLDQFKTESGTAGETDPANPAAPKEKDPVDTMKKADLLELSKSLGLDLPEETTVPVLKEAIKAKQAEGKTDPANPAA